MSSRTLLPLLAQATLGAMLGATLGAAFGAPLCAQQPAVAGLAGIRANDRVSISYVRERRPSLRTEQLVAAVVWRGQRDWDTDHGAEVIARTRTRIDSANAAARRRGRLAGGVLSAHGSGWLEYDTESRSLIVRGRAYRVPRRDSALVLLVDRVDGVGGAPTVRTVRVAAPPRTVPDIEPGADTAVFQAEIAADARSQFDAWRAALLSSARARAFVGAWTAPPGGRTGAPPPPRD